MKSWVLGPSEATQGLGLVLGPFGLPPVQDTPPTRPPAQGVLVLCASPVDRPSLSSGGSDCEKSFCSLCSVLQENLHICATCHLLKATAFQRPRLMRLRVRDLRQYLLLRNIPTNTCREKEDLVELVLCHHGIEEEEDTKTGSVNSGSLYVPTPSTTQSASELSAFVTSQEEQLSTSNSSDTIQDIGDVTSVSLLNLDPSDNTPEVSPQTRCGSRASLSDLSSLMDVEGLSVRQLKEILARNFVNYSGCCEKWELVERVGRLYRETEENRKLLEDVSSAGTTVMPLPPSLCNGAVGDGEKVPLTVRDDNLCRICMDATIDCVLLECGHMVTCTKCGKRMSECPICRQYVVRAVHVFKS
ncbi:E3 ubiquitin-protein ligase RNF34-like isoform X3 [Thalassophryne amazonica]|uniref:E3 ubiquitin-protein ligase RNF34-like isoform X3 n=1 Tax=Thalassophryne amazonica TaxID=390379 RepID=UPI0014717A54|nr:E3 ubiquitin-protein ligase RNF34-like isoform X3 [Thalassophryne amazonica]